MAGRIQMPRSSTPFNDLFISEDADEEITKPERPAVVARQDPAQELAQAFAALVAKIQYTCPHVHVLGEHPRIGIADPSATLPPGYMIVNNLRFKTECCEIFSRFGISHYDRADGILVMAKRIDRAPGPPSENDLMN